MGSLFLGVDGGGTKTTAKVADKRGNIIASTKGKTINYLSAGIETARENMQSIILELEKQTGSRHFSSAFIGMSAIYKRATLDELTGFARGIIDADITIMDSDLFIALESMGVDGECAVTICGTGSMVAGRQKDGSVFCKGGYGYLLGDEGSGYRIALEGIQAGVMAFEGANSPTLLTNELQSYFKVDDLHDLIPLFYNPQIERDVIADFAKNVFYCGDNGDSTAIVIIKTQAEKIAATTAALLREFDKSVPVGVFGGMFEHHESYINFFKNKLNALIKTKAIHLLPMPPVNGAILAALKEGNIEITQEILNNLRGKIK